MKRKAKRIIGILFTIAMVWGYLIPFQIETSAAGGLGSDRAEEHVHNHSEVFAQFEEGDACVYLDNEAQAFFAYDELKQYGVSCSSSVSNPIYQKVVCKQCSYVTVNTATCTSGGYSIIKCKVCGSQKPNTPKITTKALGHDWRKVSSKAATCGKSGENTYKCLRCNQYKGEYISPTGKHTWTCTGTKQATCTTDGTKSYKCSVCGGTKTEKITKLGHDLHTNTVEPTCGKNGVKEVKCTRSGCGYVDKTETLLATGKHTWTITKTLNPTCTMNGVKYLKCTTCDTTTNEEIPKIPHNYTWVETKAATCTEDGQRVYKCICGDTKKTETITRLGHIMEVTRTFNPTCTMNGVIHKKCARNGCNATEIEEIPKIAHTYNWVETKAATCTSDGQKAYKCICGDTKETEIITRFGHIMEVTRTFNPTCTMNGVIHKKCARNGCNATEIEEIPKIAHTYNWVETKAATCFSEGLDSYKCVCGDVSETRVIPLLEHKWDIPVKEVTYEKPQTCTVCGAVGIKVCRVSFNIPIEQEFPSLKTGDKIKMPKPKENIIASKYLEGYVFAGWSDSYKSSSVYKKADEEYTICGEIEFFAIWEPRAGGVIVKYNPNGGVGYIPDQVAFPDVDFVFSDNIPIREGYVFKGWSDSYDYLYGAGLSVNEGKAFFDLSSKPRFCETKTLYAVWVKITVTYIANNNSPREIGYSSIKGNLIDWIPDAPQEGCRFVGWAYGENSKIVFTCENTIEDVINRYNLNQERDFSLKAIWCDSKLPILIFEKSYFVETKNGGMSVVLCRTDVARVLSELTEYKSTIFEDKQDCKKVGESIDTLLETIRDVVYYSGCNYRLRDICTELENRLSSSIIDLDKIETITIQLWKEKPVINITEYNWCVIDVTKQFGLERFSGVLPLNSLTKGLKGIDSFTALCDHPDYYGLKQGDLREDEDMIAFFKEHATSYAKNKIKLQQVFFGPVWDDDVRVQKVIDDLYEAYDGGICGPVAAVNVYLYMTNNHLVSHTDAIKFLQEYYLMENDGLDWFARQGNIAGGDSWDSLTNYLSRKLKTSASAGKGIYELGRLNMDDFEVTGYNDIIRMLDSDIPVIIAFHSPEESLRLYSEDMKSFQDVDSHYFVVTGFYESEDKIARYLKVANTWGGVSYVNWYEYMSKANRGTEGAIGCSLISISAPPGSSEQWMP